LLNTGQIPTGLSGYLLNATGKELPIMLLRVLETAVAVLLVWFFITQVLIPFFRGTKMFPLFLREAGLHKTLEEVKQKAVEKKLENEIKNIKKKEGVQ
jgi:hypothetical protein